MPVLGCLDLERHCHWPDAYGCPHTHEAIIMVLSVGVVAAQEVTFQALCREHSQCLFLSANGVACLLAKSTLIWDVNSGIYNIISYYFRYSSTTQHAFLLVACFLWLLHFRNVKASHISICRKCSSLLTILTSNSSTRLSDYKTIFNVL